ncbi:MAG: hypothetical protein R3B72_14685 [Polyangiaceae bacterium]
MAGILDTALAAALESGASETVDGRPFLTLLDFGTGRRYGLSLVDGEARWARALDGVVVLFGPGTERRFLEVLEHDRRGVDDRLEAAAAAAGLPGEETLFSFPVDALVAALLDERNPSDCRLALSWLLPTDLRGLREHIAPLADDSSLPLDLRDFAAHLTVRPAGG